MKIYTVDNILSKYHYCTREWLEPLIGAGKTAQEISELEIPDGQRIELLTRVCMDEQQLRMFVCRVAERFLLAERACRREPDAASWAAIEVSRRFANGKATKEELNAARNAVHSVCERLKLELKFSTQHVPQYELERKVGAANAVYFAACPPTYEIFAVSSLMHEMGKSGFLEIGGFLLSDAVEFTDWRAME